MHLKINRRLQSIENLKNNHLKILQLLNVKDYFGEMEYLYQAINNTNPPETSQSLIYRVFYIFDEMEKIYDTEGMKLEEHKSFLNYNLVIS